MKSKGSHKFSKAEINEVLRLYVEDGLGYLQIALKTGMYWTNVAYHVRKAKKSRTCGNVQKNKALHRAKKLQKRYPNGLLLTGRTKVYYTGEVVKNGRVYTPVMACKYAKHKLFGSHWTWKPMCCPHCVKVEGGTTLWGYLRDRTKFYGTNLDDFRKLQDDQRDSKVKVCCAICGVPENGRRLDLDHSHKYKKKSGIGNRGLVCNGCNAVSIRRAERILSGEEKPPREKHLRAHLFWIIDSYLKSWEKIIKLRAKRGK